VENSERIRGAGWGSAARALGLVALVAVLLVAGLASARPGGGQAFGPAPAKPAPKVAPAPGAPAPPTQPTLHVEPPKMPPADEWWKGNGDPPPELPPSPSAEPAKEREVTPAAPGEEATRNGRMFAFAVIAGGLLCVLVGISRWLSGRGEGAAETAGFVPAPQPVAPAGPSPMGPSMPPPMGPDMHAGPSSMGPGMAPPHMMQGAQMQGAQMQARAPSMAPQGPVDSPQVGEVVNGKYRVDAVLGRDDLGVMYGVTFATLGQTCRIYVLRVELAASAPHYAQMQELARTSAASPQPGFQVFDVGALPDGRPYLVVR